MRNKITINVYISSAFASLIIGLVAIFVIACTPTQPTPDISEFVQSDLSDPPISFLRPSKWEMHSLIERDANFHLYWPTRENSLMSFSVIAEDRRGVIPAEYIHYVLKDVFKHRELMETRIGKVDGHPSATIMTRWSPDRIEKYFIDMNVSTPQHMFTMTWSSRRIYEEQLKTVYQKMLPTFTFHE